MSSSKTSPSYDHDPYLFACGGEGIVLLSYSTTEHTCQKKEAFSPHASRVNTVSWNHNNKVVISGSDDRNISMMIAEGVKTLGNLKNQSDIKTLVLSQGSKYLVTGGDDNITRVWDLKRSMIIKEHKEHTDCVTSVTFSEGDRFLATGSRSGDIIIYNMESDSVSSKLRPQTTQGVQCLSYSTHRPALLASADDNGSVHVWDTTRSKLVCSFHEHNAPCVSVQWTSMNEVLLASAGLDKKIFLYDIEEKKQVKEIRTAFPICSFMIHEDGVTLAAGTTVGTVLLYSLTKLQRPTEVTVFPSSPVSCIAFKKPKKSSRRGNSSVPKVSAQTVREMLADTAPKSIELSPQPTALSTPPMATPTNAPTQSHNNMSNGMSVFSPVQGNISSKPATFPTVDQLRNQAIIKTSNPSTAARNPGQTIVDPTNAISPTSSISSPPALSLKRVQDVSPSAMNQPFTHLDNDVRSGKSSTAPSLSTITSAPSNSYSSFGSIPSFGNRDNIYANMDLEDDFSEDSAKRRFETDSASFAASMKSKLMQSVHEPYSSEPANRPSSFIAPPTIHNHRSEVDEQSLRGNSPSIDQEMTDVHTHATKGFNFLNALDGLRPSSQPAASTSYETQQRQSLPFSTDSSQSFQTQFVRNSVEDVMSVFQAAIHESIRNLHLDMLRQFHVQSDQTNQQIANLTEQVRDLTEQVKGLQYENQRLKFLHSPE